MGKIKAAMFVTTPPRPVGGAERQALALAKALNPKGVDIIFLSEWDEGLDERGSWEGFDVFRGKSVLNILLKIVKKLKRKAEPQDSRPVRFDFSAMTAEEKQGLCTVKLSPSSLHYAVIFLLNTILLAFRQRRRFDIIHAHNFEFPAFAAAVAGKILGKKVIVKDSTMNGSLRIKNDLCGAFMQRFIIRNAGLIAVSAEIRRNYLKAGAKEENISDIPNGIDTNAAPPDRGAFSGSCLFVGNLTQQPAKGLDILIRAWPEVIARHPQARLTIAGAGDPADYLKECESLKISGTVVFAGAQKDLSGLYAKNDVFILPSRREGLSNALLEAMLAGLACVVTDISGSQDMIENERNGLVVPVDDALALAKAIDRLLADPARAREFGLRAREKVKATCDMELISGKYLRLYTSLLGGARQ